MSDAIVKLKGEGVFPLAKFCGVPSPRIIQIVGTGTTRAYVWTPIGYTTINALRRAIRQHELAQAKRRKKP